MIDNRADKLQRLSTQIGYSFKDESLLAQALSHRSVGAINNERLEFIGDSILNCTVAQELYLRSPHAKEGVLSRTRANLVCEETLAEIAKSWNLGDLLILGPGEIKSGGFNRPSILSDAVEAIIGAIYIDADMQTAQDAVRRWYETRLSNAKAAKPVKDPKSELQEFVQRKQTQLPVYEVIEATGADHQLEFHVKCSVANMLKEALGTGSSRRRAEQEAARKALDLLRK